MDRLKQEPILVVLLGLACLSGVVAAVAGSDVVTAIIGALLVAAIWLIERVAARAGSTGSFGHALFVGLAGMVVRLTIALGALLVIVVVDRPGFASAAVAFLGVYTIYMFARLWRHPAVTSTR
jgi:hypothetical protein